MASESARQSTRGQPIQGPDSAGGRALGRGPGPPRVGGSPGPVSPGCEAAFHPGHGKLETPAVTRTGALLKERHAGSRLLVGWAHPKDIRDKARAAGPSVSRRRRLPHSACALGPPGSQRRRHGAARARCRSARPVAPFAAIPRLPPPKLPPGWGVAAPGPPGHASSVVLCSWPDEGWQPWRVRRHCRRSR